MLKQEQRLKKIKETAAGYEVVFEQKGKAKSVEGEKVLMAVGRRPYHEGLKTANAGLKISEKRGAIVVNNKLETNVEGIYAVGDVTDKVLLAHVASHQGVIAVENIMGHDKEMNYDAVPGAIFTSPEIGTVGLTEAEAEEKGIDYKVGDFPLCS